MTQEQTTSPGQARGPKFTLDVEGQLIEWDEDTITAEQIAELGGWDISQGVILIDLHDNTERTLTPGEVVEVRPGLGFSKRIRFKRG
jgi:hypothetical protein